LNALGRHLLLELFDCDSDAINNLETVKAVLIEAARRAQATIVDIVFHEFNPFGISGVVVIASEHNGKVALVVSVSKDLTGRIKAGEIVKELAPIVGGGGGGRPDFAEAGGKNPAAIGELLEKAPDVIRRLA